MRKKRPDLSKTFIAISTIKDRRVNEERVMCLDTEKDTLFEIALTQEKKKPDLPMNQTFSQWMETHQGYERRFREAYQRVMARRKETEERRKRKFGQKRGFVPRPQDWKPIISYSLQKGCFFIAH